MKEWLLYLFFGSILTFFLYGLDKYKAVKGKYRIPEKFLLLVTFITGGIGGIFGQIFFHHKTKKKKFIVISILSFFFFILLFGVVYYYRYKEVYYDSSFGFKDLISKNDYDQDGLDDYHDIMLGARKDAINHPTYKSEYYKGGYPPDNIGVCTDVVWRAFKNAGYLLKDLVDKDISNNIDLYPRIAGKKDSNIDFRRVKNLYVFFERNAKVLTTDLKDYKEWMPGDIVIFGEDLSHIGILSDKRNMNGVPWLIHNAGQKNREENALEIWALTKKITGHYRWEGIK